MLKTKYYLCQKTENGYRVMSEFEPFRTEGAAYNLIMAKPEFKGVIPVLGRRILERPRLYRQEVQP